MKRGFVLFVVIGILLWCPVSLSLGGPQSPGENPAELRQFIVFDGTSYSNKPDLAAYGIRPIHLVYAGRFGAEWFKNQDRLPERASVQALARELADTGAPVVLDIEHWALKGKPEFVRQNVKKYVDVLHWFRESAPGLQIGYYGTLPIRDYWRAVQAPENQAHRDWMKEDDQIRDLRDAVDVLFPSLYTFYADQNGWKTYAIAQIKEARRVGKGKPVYVFLWPQYHDSNRALGGRYLSADFWTLQLETAHQFADGVVVWSGREEWNEHAPWWTATKRFMQRLHDAPGSSTTPLEREPRSR
ncbi:MAG TPA: hypothetical protein VFS39_09460 [Nitrospira sp.]|nr:hypothetical protein [Nitrospira sp.]